MPHHNHPILIVEDEENIQKIIAFQLAQDGIESKQVGSAEAALTALMSHRFSCVISDMKLPEKSGLDVLDFMRQNCPGTPLILLTAYGTVDMAVQALKKGAFDFLSKPYDQNELIRCVRAAQSTYKLDQPLPAPTFPVFTKLPSDEWVGVTEHAKDIQKYIQEAIKTSCHLLITGEMGTGKELLARTIHERSSNKNFPFIRVHCGAISHEMIEGELFGYEKGTHPTLLSGKPGKLELADQGTLLMEEISQLPEEYQLRLLECLQSKTVERIGAVSPRRTTFRLIATNRSPLKPGKNIREDLFLALNVMSASLLPLRDHVDDVSPIAKHLLTILNQKLKKSVKDIDTTLVNLLKRYSWPGNVRELSNVLEKMTVQCQGFMLDVPSLPEEIHQRILEGPNFEEASTLAENMINEQTDMSGGLKEIVKTATQKLEKSLIIETLKATNGNVTHAARKLEISRKSLQNKMKEFSLREKNSGGVSPSA